MTTDVAQDLLTEVEKSLQKRFNPDAHTHLPSTAAPAAEAPRVDSLVLPLEDRPKMPLTKDKFLVREDPQLVAWERVVREFLRRLSPDHEHRVSAVHIYEWATGISVADYVKEGTGQPPTDLRKINKLMREYFGKAYSTYIAGRKVPNCYRVPSSYYIKRHIPKTLTLWVEYQAGTLNP